MWLQGVWTPTVEDMDFELVIPLPECSGYSFEGRYGVNLGGEALAMLENLSVSPISVTFDLVIYDGDAYDAAWEAHGPWSAYILLLDGNRVETNFTVCSSRKWYSNEPGEEDEVYFRADHVRLLTEYPMDVSQIADIVFEGDNSMVYDGLEHVGESVYFTFQSANFRNSTYWNEVHAGGMWGE